LSEADKDPEEIREEVEAFNEAESDEISNSCDDSVGTPN
jgi:hypothetical protein